MAQGFVELNPDQRRELVNTRQRFQVWQEALARQAASRGSLVWSSSKGHEYLLRSAYDRQGQRRQVSLGLRSPETERVKAEFDRSKTEADERLRSLRPVLQRQAAVNRALGLGRVPLIGARIMRALDRAGLLGQGVRVLGTHSVYAYEAAAGVLIDPDYTTTEDIDLLLDARGGLSFIAGEDLEQASLLRLLQKVDRSFRRARQSYRAVNDDGYLVDLIKPLRNPPWSKDHAAIGDDPGDLEAVEIEGLSWHESAPPFEATAIDARGEPLRIVTSDPRVFAAHKLWLSERADREPERRQRDRAQAKLVGRLTATFLPQYPYKAAELRMLPREVTRAAKPLFVADAAPSDFDA